MKDNKNIKQKIVVIGAFILGILISLQIKGVDLDRVYITLKEKKRIELEIENTKNEINRLKKLKIDQQNILEEYKRVLNDDSKSIYKLLKEELEHYKMLCGYSSVKGIGITVTISDSDRKLKHGQNPNDLFVHDIDILRLVNDLKKSGAEAIAINNERILSSTAIKCSGATITINGITYGQPFIIKAIGSQEMLKSAVISPDSYGFLLRDVYGINIIIEEKSNIIVNKY